MKDAKVGDIFRYVPPKRPSTGVGRLLAPSAIYKQGRAIAQASTRIIEGDMLLLIELSEKGPSGICKFMRLSDTMLLLCAFPAGGHMQRVVKHEP